jgi:hypothetical protein
MARRLEVEIVGDAGSLNRALGQSTTATRRFGTSLGTVTKAGAAFGVGFTVVQQGLRLFGNVANRAWSEMSEGQTVLAQTEAVLKSTGGVANVTSKQITTLAQSLSKLTGVDDEAIQSGENMLATFTKIHNEVGKGNDIFNQATKATLDLSVALGKDMPSAALMVGKALNDPIAGMTALGRAGVQFTASQKETIKALVESGDLLGAQKIILGELTTQMGGSAAAFGETLPGAIAKARNAFDEMAAGILTSALPALEGMASLAARAAGFFAENETAAKALSIAIGALAAALVLAAGAQLAMNLAVLANPYVAAAVAVAALGVGLVLLWQHSETARKVIIGLGLAVAFLPTVLIIAYRESETFRTVVVAAFNAAMAAANAMKGAAISLAGFLEGGFQAAASVATAAINAARTAAAAVATAFNAVKTAASAVSTFLGGAFANEIGAAKAILSGIGRVADAVASALYAIANAARSAAQAIRDIPSLPSLGGLGGALGGLLPPGLHRAGGGPVTGRTPYIVGERGPELFVPGASGSIVPNHALSGGINVYISAPIGSERDLQNMVVSALATVNARGGIS